MNEKALPTLIELHDRVEAMGESLAGLNEAVVDYEVRTTARQLELMAMLQKIADRVGVVDVPKSGDELLADATQAVIDYEDVGSVSILAHRLDVGHARVEMLIKLLEEQQLIDDGPAPRKIVSIKTEPVG